jgi:hypothetical protein
MDGEHALSGCYSGHQRPPNSPASPVTRRPPTPLPRLVTRKHLRGESNLELLKLEKHLCHLKPSPMLSSSFFPSTITVSHHHTLSQFTAAAAPFYNSSCLQLRLVDSHYLSQPTLALTVLAARTMSSPSSPSRAPPHPPLPMASFSITPLPPLSSLASLCAREQRGECCRASPRGRTTTS